MLDEIRMNSFIISLCHLCMYGRGRVLEGVVELGILPLLA